MSSNSNSLDLTSFGILISIALKCTALIPTIVQVVKTKTVEEISLITPAFYAVAFFILILIAINKQYHIPLAFFIVGFLSAIILLTQKIIYEQSGNGTENIQYDKKNDNIPIIAPDFEETDADTKTNYFDEIKKYENKIDTLQKQK